MDTDQDGVQDAGEIGVAGATMFLDLNHNGPRDTGEPTTTTDTGGAYEFTGLTGGTYTVVPPELAAGWWQTLPGYDGTIRRVSVASDGRRGTTASVPRAAVDGLAMGVGMTLVLMVLGGLREFVGQGTLFAQGDLMLGSFGKALMLSLGADFHGAILAILPPGAFIFLGLLIALKNLVDKRVRQREAARTTAAPAAGTAPQAAG